MPARGFGLLLEHPPIQQADADGWTQFLVAVPLTHLSSIILAVVVRSEFLPHSSAALARVVASEAFSKVAGEAVQLHGGIAITWESDIQLYFKRAHGSSQLFGLPTQHLRRLQAEVL